MSHTLFDPDNRDYLGAANRRLRHYKHLYRADAVWEDAWGEIRFDRPQGDWERDVRLWDAGTYSEAVRTIRREADLHHESDNQKQPPQPPLGNVESQLKSFAGLFLENSKKHVCELCEQCPMDQVLRSLGKRYKLCDSLPELRESAKSCEAYELVLASIEQSNYPELSEIYVSAKRLFLSEKKAPREIQASMGLWRAILGTGLVHFLCNSYLGIIKPRVCRVFVDLQYLNEGRVARNEIPILPKAGGEFDILLYREWLRRCNRCHKHIDSYIAMLPTRVIDVGDNDNSECVRLRITNGKARGRYISLSHRWQKDTPTTTTTNLNDRRKAIKLNDLPKTFQDVIRITRRLGVRYLWIDSLCIIQDSSLDWSVESRKMGRLYASAYCTIAAQCVSKTGGSFEQDVENGELSHRGWILQERALSRRTIHLAGEQTYWECGSVIWSKTADEGAKPRSSLASCEFPKLDLPAAHQDSGAMFQHVFSSYSRLSFTQDTDRPVAIAGIEYRMEAFYETISVYGIVKSFFGESVLWQRSGDEWMKPLINFKAQKLASWLIKGKRVPSWSWMAYVGEIRYGNICTDGLSWKTDFEFDHMDNPGRCLITAPLMQISSRCRIQLTEWGVRDENEDMIGWTRFDCWDEYNIACRTCISIAEGTTGWREFACISQEVELLSGGFDYVLLLRPVEADMYRRIGVAIILSRYLSPSTDSARVF